MFRNGTVLRYGTHRTQRRRPIMEHPLEREGNFKRTPPFLRRFFYPAGNIVSYWIKRGVQRGHPSPIKEGAQAACSRRREP